MYETLEHWKQYKQKKYQQCPAEKPGGMILNEMKEAEEAEELAEQEKALQAKIAKEFQLFDNSTKLVSEYDKESFDKWMNELIASNGTTKY